MMTWFLGFVIGVVIVGGLVVFETWRRRPRLLVLVKRPPKDAA